MKDINSPGCSYIAGNRKLHSGRRSRPHSVFCDKIPAENSRYCPKHLPKFERRNQKILAEGELSASPLASINPEFKEKHNAAWIKGGYGI